MLLRNAVGLFFNLSMCASFSNLNISRPSQSTLMHCRRTSVSSEETTPLTRLRNKIQGYISAGGVHEANFRLYLGGVQESDFTLPPIVANGEFGGSDPFALTESCHFEQAEPF
jgi:hypothetical protein